MNVDDEAAKFNCHACVIGSNCDAEGRWPGSRGRAAGPIFVLPRRGANVGPPTTYDTCPLPLVGAWWPVLRTMFIAFDAGHLLRPGGLAHQPAWYVTAMGAIASERHACEKDRMDRERKAREADAAFAAQRR